jgi:hypothetical protein
MMEPANSQFLELRHKLSVIYSVLWLSLVLYAMIDLVVSRF